MSKIEFPNNIAPIDEEHCRVIAEAGANHNNSVERAVEMARQAAEAGAWAIKFQLYKAGTIAVRNSPKYWNDRFGTSTQYEAFRLSDKLDYGTYAEIAAACRDFGIGFFATPFDFHAIEVLESMDVPMYKIASGDITHRPLLEAVSQTGKPIFLSTGAATLDEIDSALEWLDLGPDKLVILACTLTYPTPDTDGNFARIDTLRSQYAPFMIGFSDHTLGVAGGWMTAALGGVAIEKHYTLDKGLPDVPDHAMSVDPQELSELVAACNRGIVLRGSAEVGVRESELPARQMARRSIVAAGDMPAGHVIVPDDLDYKRPGGGLSPAQADVLLGHRLAAPVPVEHVFRPEDVV